ncbi:C1 family peptidase, partial [Gammaproteobacteria bacterium]|nr:C1 family peptidase [Gammaproteobacteria bacterium]
TCVSIPDKRDWICEYIQSDKKELPIILDYLEDQLPVRDQGSCGSGSAFAACTIKEWHELKNNNLKIHMSPQFIYNSRENKDRCELSGRDIMKILKKNGTVEEDHYKYGTVETPSIYVRGRARNYRITGYARIETMNGLKTALVENGPCYISFPVYNFSKHFWRKTSECKTVNGCHGLTVVGYDELGFLLKNSWGVDWNGGGYTRYPFTQWGDHLEMFTCIDDIDSVLFTDEKVRRMEEKLHCDRLKLEEDERSRIIRTTLFLEMKRARLRRDEDERLDEEAKKKEEEDKKKEEERSLCFPLRSVFKKIKKTMVEKVKELLSKKVITDKKK